ncbi:FAD:protein FMN transferase [Micromonospora haikouensis]|uniref:FAD:protein FMN transferase n=1 Tax=Micromonospora haikouensis TaxID=686309 RepID=UPI003D71FA9F
MNREPGHTWESRWSHRGRPVRVAVTDRHVLPAARRELTLLLAGLRRGDATLTRALRAAGRPVPVGPLLRDLVGVALSAAEASDGAVDPTVEAARLRRRRVPGLLPVCGGAAAGPVPVANWRAVTLAGDLLALPPTLPLGLAATATAQLARRCAQRIAARTGAGVLVGVGNRAAVAGPAPPGGWPVAVGDRVVALTAGGLATADVRVDGGVLDPRTGAAPVSPWTSVTVVAPDAVRAAMLAVGALAHGPHGPDWLAARIGDGVAYPMLDRAVAAAPS